jgi:hypothetical protein
VRIRLTEERWAHIASEHAEMAGLELKTLAVIAEPEEVFLGGSGALLAVSELEASKWIVAVYREEEDDGFVITAFLTRRRSWLDRRRRVWP